MFKLVIQDDEGKTTVVPLIRDEITIGRKEGNTIRLTERNVSRRHARILRNTNNGEVHIEDLGSYNGIRVNNARIAERVSLRVSDQVQIGDYKLYLKAEGLEQADDARTMPLERVDSQVPTEAMAAVAPGGTAPHLPQAPAAAPMIGSPNRTMVAIADTDPTGRTIGPATAAAVAALNAPGGYGKLVVLSSNFAGKEFELSRPQMIIGRTDENDIVINHRSISRNHAKLVREPETGRYTISDLQSSNGVRVNGQDYGKVELRRGDVVDLGHVRLRFVEAGEDFVFARDAVITDVPETGGRRGLMVAILAAVVVVVAGIVLYTMRGGEPPRNADGAGSGTNGGYQVADAGDTAIAVTDPRPGAEVVEDAAVVAPAHGTPSVKPDQAKSQKDACIALLAGKRWQELEDCALALDSLSPQDAKEFHATAKRETLNEQELAIGLKAIRDRNLRDAQASLNKIGPSSVYYVGLHDQIAKAEAAQVEDTKRKAQALKSDCKALARFQQQIAATATSAVIAASTSVKCTQVATDPVVAAKPPATSPTGTGSGTPAPPTPAKNPCETTNVDDLLTQAANQFTAGYAKSALSLVTKALACKADVRMFRLAAMYACAGHDLGNAKLYFAKIPPQYQSAIEQRCQQENMNVRGTPPSP
jgi:pSer/pThr/pTyr-binding forkhead associated (FHA) protein